jgi:hypothetical protein
LIYGGLKQWNNELSRNLSDIIYIRSAEIAAVNDDSNLAVWNHQ